MTPNESLYEIIRMLIRNWKWIARNIIIGAILAIVVSFLLPNYYKASTIFYPASSDMIKPEHLFGNANKDMEYYGNGMDLDRMLAISNSNDLYNFMIDSFNLFSRYKIDSTSAKSRFAATKVFQGLYQVNKNKLDAIELSVEDKDPKMAANMANAAMFKIDQLMANQWKRSLLELSVTMKENTKKKQKEVLIINDSMKLLRSKYNIIDPETQSELLTQKTLNTETRLQRDKERLRVLQSTSGVPRDTINMLRAMVAGLEKEYFSLTDTASKGMMNLSNFNNGRSQVEILLAQQRTAKDLLSYYINRQNQINGMIESKIQSIHIVESADVPLVKSRPFRSLIVLGVSFLSLMVSILGLIIMDSLKDPRWKKLWGD